MKKIMLLLGVITLISGCGEVACKEAALNVEAFETCNANENCITSIQSTERYLEQKNNVESDYCKQYLKD